MASEESTLAEKLGLECVAQSLWRVFTRALGMEIPPSGWDGLAEQEQQQWLKVARRADETLSRLDGCTYQEAGEKLAETLNFYEQFSHPSWCVAWEAVARVAHQLLDSDEWEEGQSLDQLEERAQAWACAQTLKSLE